MLYNLLLGILLGVQAAGIPIAYRYRISKILTLRTLDKIKLFNF